MRPRPYALCVMLFNMFRRLILGAYCAVIGGIPAHNEGILGGSRNCTQCRFISIQSSHKRRYSAHTATSLPLFAFKLLGTACAPRAPQQLSTAALTRARLLQRPCLQAAPLQNRRAAYCPAVASTRRAGVCRCPLASPAKRLLPHPAHPTELKISNCTRRVLMMSPARGAAHPRARMQL